TVAVKTRNRRVPCQFDQLRGLSRPNRRLKAQGSTCDERLGLATLPTSTRSCSWMIFATTSRTITWLVFRGIHTAGSKRSHTCWLEQLNTGPASETTGQLPRVTSNG